MVLSYYNMDSFCNILNILKACQVLTYIQKRSNKKCKQKNKIRVNKKLA